MSIADRVAVSARRLGMLGLYVFAWSLPLSLFGMQLGVGLMAVSWLLDPERRDGRTPIHWALAWLLLAICLSLLLSPAPPRSFMSATSFWVMAAFFTSYRQLRRLRQQGLLLGGIIAGATVAALWGLYQAASGNYPLFDLLHAGMNRQLRLVPNTERAAAVGFFFSRLTFAHVSLFPLCWAVVLAWNQRRIHYKVVWGAAAAVLAAGLWATWTRAALLAAVAALAFFGLEKMRGRRRLLALGALAVLGASLLAASPLERQRLFRSFAGRSDWSRLAIWHSAIDLANSSPLAGIGYGNFKRDARPLLEARTHQAGLRKFAGVLAWAHDNLLTFLAETGLLGALAFCLLFVAFFRASAAGRQRTDVPPAAAALVDGGRAAALGFLLVGLFHDNFFDGEVAFNLWFCLAAALAAYPGAQTQQNENKEKETPAAIPLPGTDPGPRGGAKTKQLTDKKAQNAGTGPGRCSVRAAGALEVCCWGLLLFACMVRPRLPMGVALAVMFGALAIFLWGRGEQAVGLLLAGPVLGGGPWLGRVEMTAILVLLLIAVPLAFLVSRRRRHSGATRAGEFARYLETGLAVELLAVWTLASFPLLLLAWRSTVDFRAAGLQILPIAAIFTGLVLLGLALAGPGPKERTGMLAGLRTAAGRICVGSFLVAVLRLVF